MGLIGKPVPVEVDEQGYPRRFFWRRWYQVSEILDEWREVGTWWEGEEERLVVRVLTAEGAIFELERFLREPVAGADESSARPPAGTPAGRPARVTAQFPAGPSARFPAPSLPWRLYKVYD